MRPMRAQWPAFSVNDLKAWFRGRKYVIETSAIPGREQNPVTTSTFLLPFRKHPCENSPLTGTI
jgi:hypothetical protein